jgi:undecaprenyl-diphosphatase
MNILHSVLLGIVEGITEFLPISSTFHLIFTSKLLGLKSTEFQTMYEVVIQSGAILAALALYTKELINDRKMAINVIVAFIPTAIIGLILHKVIKEVFFENSMYMLSAFVSMGIVFLIIESLIQKKKLVLTKSIKDMTYKQAILIGLAQSFAVVPGVSRAGAVMVGMMGMKFKREESAKFSFLVAIPTILAASGLDLLKGRETLMNSGSNILLLLVGFVVSGIVAYIVMKWFIKYLQQNTLIPFAIYRFVLVIIILLAVKDLV